MFIPPHKYCDLYQTQVTPKYCTYSHETTEKHQLDPRTITFILPLLRMDLLWWLMADHTLKMVLLGAGRVGCNSELRLLEIFLFQTRLWTLVLKSWIQVKIPSKPEFWLAFMPTAHSAPGPGIPCFFPVHKVTVRVIKLPTAHQCDLFTNVFLGLSTVPRTV